MTKENSIISPLSIGGRNTIVDSSCLISVEKETWAVRCDLSYDECQEKALSQRKVQGHLTFQEGELSFLIRTNGAVHGDLEVGPGN